MNFVPGTHLEERYLPPAPKRYSSHSAFVSPLTESMKLVASYPSFVADLVVIRGKQRGPALWGNSPYPRRLTICDSVDQRSCSDLHLFLHFLFSFSISQHVIEMPLNAEQRLFAFAQITFERKTGIRFFKPFSGWAGGQIRCALFIFLRGEEIAGRSED